MAKQYVENWLLTELHLDVLQNVHVELDDENFSYSDFGC